MATQFVFGYTGSTVAQNLVPAMLAGPSCTSETISESGSNQQTTATAKTGSGGICRVVASVSVYVSFGANPNAGTDTTRFYLPANAIEYFAVQSGWKGAVITA